MKTSDFDYHLPQELIAQTPIEPRDRSRLMVLNRSDGSLEHHRFDQITNYLSSGDVLVFNNSRVIPARLKGKKAGSGGRVELLLLHRLSPNTWETLVRPAQRVRPGTKLELPADSITEEVRQPKVTAEVVESLSEGRRVVSFADEIRLYELGEVPLPPYIHTPLKTPERYQTVYASNDGSAASPTAGLHFTPELISEIEAKGVRCLYVTLHIGLDTFMPVREENPLDHQIHNEYGVLDQETAEELTRAREEGRRIICVGTTTVRLLEAAARAGNANQVQPFEGWVSLFILPGYRFRIVAALLTNFHLPRSTLLMLVTAFAGRETINKSYREAIARKYRFYSFGDAMLIL